MNENWEIIYNEFGQHIDNPVQFRVSAGYWITGVVRTIKPNAVEVELWKETGEFDGRWNYRWDQILAWSFDDPQLQQRFLNKIYKTKEADHV